MPDETSKYLHEVEVKTVGKEALEQLLEAIKKVEQAVVTMGEKFDKAAQTIATPIKELDASFNKLATSLERMQRGLGETTPFETQRQAVQLLKSDILDADRAIEQFRIKGTRGFKLPGAMGGQFQSRQQMLERYFAGELGPNVWSGVAQQGPQVGTPPGGAREVSQQMIRRTALQYETAEAAARELGISVEELGDRAQQTTAVFAEQDQVLRAVIATTVEQAQMSSQMAAATDQETASTTRLAGQLEMLNQVRTRQQSLWRQLMSMEGEWQRTVAAGGRVAEQLRQQATPLTRQMGAAIAERAGQVQRGWTPATMYGAETRPGWETRGPEQRAFGGRLWGAEETEELNQAMGRKIVLQQLMARGSKDVAEKFERQGRETRSKSEILREISRTGKMTTEMEKELGLQTERTGQQARRAGGMMRYFGRYLLRYLLLWQGIQAVRGISRTWFAAHVEMSDAVADFGWRVNATAEDVDRYRDKLRDVSMLVGMPVGEIASPLAGRATEADLLRAAEAARVFGGSVEDWARKIDAGAASLDAYAHGLRISTLATADYAKLVDNASAIAQEFNMTEEETIGLLSALPSVLKTDAEGAAELTEALAGLYEQNQLLMTLGMAPAVRVGAGGAPQRRPMAEVMAEIGQQPVAQQRQLAVAIGLTSEKQQQFFLDAVAGWAEVVGAINGAAGATDEFDKAMDSLADSVDAHKDRVKAAWVSLVQSIGNTDWMKGVLTDFEHFLQDIGRMIRGEEDLFEEYKRETGLAAAEIDVGEFREWRRRRGREVEGGAAEPGRGYTGVTPGAEVAPGVGAAYFPPMPTMRLPEGMGIGQLAAEMERVIDEVFTRPYTTASGEVIQVTKEQIDALRKNTIILDETGEAIGLLNVYGPALSTATENLKTEVARFNLERLKDITPEQFDVAMQTKLPMWEARLAAIPGFEEERELHTFFVGEQDILRQQLATQTGMAYTLQDILDTEKDQLEGMWNIPTGVTMRVPLQSLDLMRWMQQGAGGGVATDMMLGPGTPGGALESAATAQDNAAIAMQASSGAQTAAAASMSQLAQSVGAGIYGGVPVEPGVAKEEALATGDTGLRQQINRRPRPIPGAAGNVAPAPLPLGGLGTVQAQFAINLVSTLLLDGKIVAEAVQTELARQLVNTTRASAGGGASLRP